jgi:hypothetical protein
MVLQTSSPSPDSKWSIIKQLFKKKNKEDILMVQNSWRTTEKIVQERLHLELPKDIKVIMMRP